MGFEIGRAEHGYRGTARRGHSLRHRGYEHPACGGGLLAHYTVHPGSFYIDTIGKVYAYSWAKSWHLQLAIFWIAISWVGTSQDAGNIPGTDSVQPLISSRLT